MENFEKKTFAGGPKTMKFVNVFSLESFLLSVCMDPHHGHSARNITHGVMHYVLLYINTISQDGRLGNSIHDRQLINSLD